MIGYLIAIGFGMFLLAVIIECVEDVKDMRRNGKTKDFWARVMSWHQKAEYVTNALAAALTYVIAFMVTCATWPINRAASKPLRAWYKSKDADKAEKKKPGDAGNETKVSETKDKAGATTEGGSPEKGEGA